VDVTSAPDDWERHWSDYTAANQLNPAQDYRRRLIFEALALGRDGSGVRLLELGSGSGEFAAEVRRRYPRAELLGLELSQTGVEIALQRVPGSTFLQQDLLRPLKIPATYRGWATHAVCSEVLEHVDQPVQLLRNARACLGPACRVVITVPGGPMSEFDRHIGHRRHFSEQILRDVLDEAGLTTQYISGAGFPFFNLYRLAVIARGKSLVSDLQSSTQQGLALPARLAMRLFSVLFAFNSSRLKLGWQLVSVSTLSNERDLEPGVETSKEGALP
jgi:SAM-dependent methyltransferase